MTSTGGPPPHGDLTGRMSLFGRLFAQQAGLLDPAQVNSAEDLIALVRIHVPRKPPAESAEDAPVYEAAAYVGEWLRAHAGAEWVSEAGMEPHVQMYDPSGAVVLLVPLVHVMRTATTAGYDGLPKLLRTLRDEAATPAAPTTIDGLDVHPKEDRERVVSWVKVHAALHGGGTRVALWRRCSACGTPREESISMPDTGLDWESEAGLAAGLLSDRPFGCACGGKAGDVSRLLMIRREPEGVRLGDIYVTPTHTRVACWTLEGNTVRPFDARALADEAEQAH